MTETETLTFEKVWAALMENKEQMKESAQKSDREWLEIKEQMKETDRQIQEYNKRFGNFTRRFGEVIEYMITPNLQEKFSELGLVFSVLNSNSAVNDKVNNIFLEIDAKLENNEKVMLVEIKTKLATEDVNDHIVRLEKMRLHADIHGDKRRFLGAVAGVVMTAEVKKYALGQGFYVIEPSGETFTITPPAGQPKEW